MNWSYAADKWVSAGSAGEYRIFERALSEDDAIFSVEHRDPAGHNHSLGKFRRLINAKKAAEAYERCSIGAHA